MKLKINDVVMTKSYGEEDLWKVTSIYDTIPTLVELKGLTNRSIIRVPENQLQKVDNQTINKLMRNQYNTYQLLLSKILQRKRFLDYSREEDKSKLIFQIPGSILHLDGDKSFMDECVEGYKKLGIPSIGYSMDLLEFPNKIVNLLEKHNPDILVVTGHDGYDEEKDPNSLDSYYASKYYVETVKKARNFNKNKDNLIIFAGACNSFFEELMIAGANFASSPKRIKIGKFDPAIIASIMALTPCLSKINLIETVSQTESGFNGIGGIETEGTLRNAIPNMKVLNTYNTVSPPRYYNPFSNYMCPYYKYR